MPLYTKYRKAGCSATGTDRQVDAENTAAARRRARSARLRVLLFELDAGAQHQLIGAVVTPPLSFPEGRPCYTATLESP